MGTKNLYTVINAIREEPGMTSPEIASVTNMNLRTVQRHLRDLIKNGLITSERVDKQNSFRYYFLIVLETA